MPLSIFYFSCSRFCAAKYPHLRDAYVKFFSICKKTLDKRKIGAKIEGKRKKEETAMQRHLIQRTIALLTALILAFCLVFSSAYFGVNADHECLSPEDCPICTEMSLCAGPPPRLPAALRPRPSRSKSRSQVNVSRQGKQVLAHLLCAAFACGMRPPAPFVLPFLSSSILNILYYSNLFPQMTI